jgi:hypothetical protein
MSDLLERLRSTLADRYTIERERSRGGMARRAVGRYGQPMAELFERLRAASRSATLAPDRETVADESLLPLYT